MNSAPRVALCALLLPLITSCFLFRSTHPGADPLAGFKALAIPRENVPIGARWVDGRGPAGPSASPDNIGVERSLTTQALNDELRAQIDTQVAKHFGLSSEVARKVSISYGGLTVHTVADLERLGLTTGQSVIYEALKVATISVTYDNSLGADLRATASAKRIPIESTVEGGSKSTTTFSGSDLFIAYRVMQLEHGGTDVETRRFDDDELRFSMGDYEFEIDARPMARCFCSESGQDPRITWCGGVVDTPIIVRNPKVVSVGGKVQEQVLLYRNHNRDVPYQLAATSSGDELVTTTARLNLQFNGSNNGICLFTLMGEFSRAELSTTRIRLTPLWAPSAPGW